MGIVAWSLLYVLLVGPGLGSASWRRACSGSQTRARDAMTYLFAAFAVVWVGLFLYRYGLVRRSRRLEREVEALVARSRPVPPSGARPR